MVVVVYCVSVLVGVVDVAVFVVGLDAVVDNFVAADSVEIAVVVALEVVLLCAMLLAGVEVGLLVVGLVVV